MAEDAKTFPGATCQTTSSADPVSRRSLNGRMQNEGTSDQTWICPVVRDAVDVATGVEFAQIIVTSATASCSFRSVTETGDRVEFASPDTIIPRGSLRILQYRPGDRNIANAEDGYYYFDCRIPAGSGVLMYRLDENEIGES